MYRSSPIDFKIRNRPRPAFANRPSFLTENEIAALNQTIRDLESAKAESFSPRAFFRDRMIRIFVGVPGMFSCIPLAIASADVMHKPIVLNTLGYTLSLAAFVITSMTPCIATLAWGIRRQAREDRQFYFFNHGISVAQHELAQDAEVRREWGNFQTIIRQNLQTRLQGEMAGPDPVSPVASEIVAAVKQLDSNRSIARATRAFMSKGASARRIWKAASTIDRAARNSKIVQQAVWKERLAQARL